MIRQLHQITIITNGNQLLIQKSTISSIPPPKKSKLIKLINKENNFQPILSSNFLNENTVRLFCNKKIEPKNRYVELSIEDQLKLFNNALFLCDKKKIEDIYTIGYKKFIQTPQGKSIFNYYNHSIVKMCYSIFPNYNWRPWLFIRNLDYSRKRKEKDYDYKDEIIWFAQKENLRNWDCWDYDNFLKFRKDCKIPKDVDFYEIVNHIKRVYSYQT
ncbi:hypothetical protein ACTFIV_009267 [Dictyostelium citrinum]